MFGGDVSTLLLLVLVLEAGCVAGVVFLIHLCFTLPMRRTERARLFLNLLEGALKRGQSVEPAILSAAENHDRAIGVRFHLVAAHIEDGARLGEALEKVPSFLPPQVNAMILAGEKLGDLKKVLPACREVLRVAPDTVRTTMHYLMVAIGAAIRTRCHLADFVVVHYLLFPNSGDVAAGMGLEVWPLALFVFALNDSGFYLVGFEAVLFLVLADGDGHLHRRAGLCQVVSNPRPPGGGLDRVADSVEAEKLLRAFSAMLAVLLDNGVPEAEAVRLAGDCTANEICRRRSRNARRRGSTWKKARTSKTQSARKPSMTAANSTGASANATHARNGFLKGALRGWHEALDAKAFQQEETATVHGADQRIGHSERDVVALGLIAISHASGCW